MIAVPTCSTYECNNGTCGIGQTSGNPFCICNKVGVSGDHCEIGKIKNSKAHCNIVSAGQLSSIIDAILMLNYMRIMLKCSVDVIWIEKTKQLSVIISYTDNDGANALNGHCFGE